MKLTCLAGVSLLIVVLTIAQQAGAQTVDEFVIDYVDLERYD